MKRNVENAWNDTLVQRGAKRNPTNEQRALHTPSPRVTYFIFPWQDEQQQPAASEQKMNELLTARFQAYFPFKTVANQRNATQRTLYPSCARSWIGVLSSSFKFSLKSFPFVRQRRRRSPFVGVRWSLPVETWEFGATDASKGGDDNEW